MTSQRRRRQWRHNDDDDDDDDDDDEDTISATNERHPSTWLSSALFRCDSYSPVVKTHTMTLWLYDAQNESKFHFEKKNTRHKYETRGFYLFIVISSSESGD